mgnify:CR=1 FL=1
MITSTVGLIIVFAIVFSLCIFIIWLLPNQKGYFRIFPSITLYPNNEVEALKVKEITDNRTSDDIKFFHLTDYAGPISAFRQEFPQHESLWKNITLNRIIWSPLIVALKLIVNRARPKQTSQNIAFIETNTTNTPAYPSGHSFEAYLLARQLEKRDPALSKRAWELAEKCSNARVKGGVHYPSDGAFSKSIVKRIPTWML